MLAKVGFDTAENESVKVCLISFNFQVMGFNFYIGTPPAVNGADGPALNGAGAGADAAAVAAVGGNL